MKSFSTSIANQLKTKNLNINEFSLSGALDINSFNDSNETINWIDLVFAKFVYNNIIEVIAND